MVERIRKVRLPTLVTVRASEAARITRMGVVEQRAKRARGQLRQLTPGEHGAFDVFDLAEMSFAQMFARFRMNTERLQGWMHSAALANIGYWALVHKDEKIKGLRPSVARQLVLNFYKDWKSPATHMACWPGRLYSFFEGHKRADTKHLFETMPIPFNTGPFVVLPLREMGEDIARAFDGPLTAMES